MIARLKELFFPVIHCIDPNTQQGIGHALRNTEIAKENGADGVFLIGHGMHFCDLHEIYEHVRRHFPTFWIGINFLDLSNEKKWDRLVEMADQCSALDGLWIDGMPDQKLLVPSSVKVFGGVGFKYINPHIDGDALESACRAAVQIVDVVTTSGNKTGSAPDIDKLISIKRCLGDKNPLALASGVDANNVSAFLEYVDIFLVASSICERISSLGNHEYLIPQKVRELADLIHG
ncbi:MAG: BtpA/SgcQ family protein [Candidatus Paceibacterota bacterium]|jgi:hypothetical protein